jgi:chemotaxis protein methyltransferase CheR
MLELGSTTLAATTFEEPAERSGAELNAVRRLARIAQAHFGLDLPAGKSGMIAARLAKRMRQRGLATLDDYAQFVEADATGAALGELVEALTTHHTSFFRESRHFDFLRDQAAPQWRQQAQLNIWCAACSTGEEAFSIAMTLREAGREDARVWATDISAEVLAAAERGLYRGECFPQPYTDWMKRYLLRGRDRMEGWYRVKPEVRRMVEFAPLNLVRPTAVAGAYQAIFCRNAMLYFDRRTQQDVVRMLEAKLAPGGYLFVGHAESLTGIAHGMRYVAPAIYVKAEEDAR